MGHRSELIKYDVFLFLKIVLTSAKSVYPDEMSCYAAFHLGLHCLPKYPFKGFQHTRVKALWIYSFQKGYRT